MTGEELRQARTDFGLTANEMARLVGVQSRTDPGSTVRRWERGRYEIPPHVILIIALCRQSKDALQSAITLADELYAQN